jgi:hypothetical protein
MTSLYKKAVGRIPKIIEESMSIVLSVDCPRLSTLNAEN